MTFTTKEWIFIVLAAGAVLVSLLAWLFPRQKSIILRWKSWPIVPNRYRYYRRKFRMHRAKNIMRSKLEGSRLTILTRIYSGCLAENHRTSNRNMLGDITPEKPSWLNDYYVASALESLWREGKIVKATKFELNGFPPRPEFYLFVSLKEGTTAKQQADLLETDSQCLGHQIFNQCLKADRYETSVHSETTAPGTTSHGTNFHLKEGAAQCSRCWDIRGRQSHIRLLVDDITRYDLSTKATLEITGMNREFQEAVIVSCLESQCAAEVAPVKGIVERATEIRGSQLGCLPAGHKTDWTEELTTGFISSLSAYIKSKIE